MSAATKKQLSTTSGTFVQNVGHNLTINGKIFSLSKAGTAFVTFVEIALTLEAAKTGTLTTRTSNTAGTLTMDSGHGITTGQRLDIYWSGGSCRGATVGTVSTNSVPFTGATGTNLPSASTAITAQVPELCTLPASLVVANNVCLGATLSNSSAYCTISLGAGSFTEQAAIILNGSTWGASCEWSDTFEGTSPIAAGTTITQVYVSHGDSAVAPTFYYATGSN